MCELEGLDIENKVGVAVACFLIDKGADLKLLVRHKSPKCHLVQLTNTAHTGGSGCKERLSANF